MSEYVIRSVVFGDNYVEVFYMIHPDDVRANGTVLMTRTLSIDTDKGDYGDEREAVEDAVKALLTDALEDFNRPPTLAEMEENL